MHHLRIQGFLGIRDAEIMLDGLTVLIGSQASGKSVIARLIYFFNEYFADFNITAISNNEHKSSYDRRKREEFYKIFPQYSWENSEFTITYANEDHEVMVYSRESSSIIDIATSPSVAAHFRSLKAAYRRTYEDFEEHEKEQDFPPRLRVRFAFREMMRKSDLVQYEPALFVPAARSFYATIRDEIFSILALDEKIDHIILKFGEFYEATKARLTRLNRHHRYTRSPQFKRIIKGSFEREGGQDWLRMDHGSIEMSKASSGQQEALPLLLSILDYPRAGRTLIIEEPEAHLFPEAQTEVLNFMVRQLRTRQGNIMFTTHSPYLLSALNNRLLAHERGARNGIPIEKVRVYAIANGESRSVVDEEMGLIAADYIDSVSEKIAREFEELLEESS